MAVYRVMPTTFSLPWSPSTGELTGTYTQENWGYESGPGGGGAVHGGGGGGSVGGGGSYTTGGAYTPTAAPAIYQPTAAPTANLTAQQAQLQDVNPLLQRRYEEELRRSGYDPYMASLERMKEGEFGPDDPSYRWRLAQGQQAVERSLAARGLLGSGNAGIELLQYGQGLASTEFANQWNRLLAASGQYQNMLSGATSRLASLAGIDLSQRQLALSAEEFNAQQRSRTGEFNANYGLQAWGQQQQFGLQASQLGLQSWQSQNQLGLQGWEAANRFALQQRQLDIDASRAQSQSQAQLSSASAQMQSVWDEQARRNAVNSGMSWARQTMDTSLVPSTSSYVPATVGGPAYDRNDPYSGYAPSYFQNRGFWGE